MVTPVIVRRVKIVVAHKAPNFLIAVFRAANFRSRILVFSQLPASPGKPAQVNLLT